MKTRQFVNYNRAKILNVQLAKKREGRECIGNTICNAFTILPFPANFLYLRWRSLVRLI